MEIRGTAVYSLKLFRKVNSFNIMKNKVIVGLYAVLEIIVIFLFIILLLYSEKISDNIAYICVMGVMAVFIPGFFFSLPFIYAQFSKNLCGIEHSFVFTDDGLNIFSKGPTMTSQADMKYESFFKVYETTDYFYFYLTRLQLYPLGKKDIEDNKAYDLRNLLLSKLPRNKYVLTAKK